MAGANTEKAKIVKTVGELIAALHQFPKDMVIDVDVSDSVVVYLLKPPQGAPVRAAWKNGFVRIAGIYFDEPREVKNG